MKLIRDMSGWEIREELWELNKPRLAQEKRNRETFLMALAPRGYNEYIKIRE